MEKPHPKMRKTMDVLKATGSVVPRACVVIFVSTALFSVCSNVGSIMNMDLPGEADRIVGLAADEDEASKAWVATTKDEGTGDLGATKRFFKGMYATLGTTGGWITDKLGITTGAEEEGRKYYRTLAIRQAIADKLERGETPEKVAPERSSILTPSMF